MPRLYIDKEFLPGYAKLEKNVQRAMDKTFELLWCEVVTSSGFEWLNFNYDATVNLNLTGNALTLTFLQSEPLCLSGTWAPWCAAVIAHFRFGHNASLVVPALHQAALMS